MESPMAGNGHWLGMQWPGAGWDGWSAASDRLTLTGDARVGAEGPPRQHRPVPAPALQRGHRNTKGGRRVNAEVATRS